MSRARLAVAGPLLPCLLSSADAQLPNYPKYLASDLPQLLGALISDCFQSTMDSRALSTERLEYVNRFHKYLLASHSHENLAFLMEVFRYEYFYERLAEKPVGSGNTVGSSLADPSLELFMDTLPYPTPSMSLHLRKNSVKCVINASLASVLADIPSDLEFDEPAVSRQGAWNHFTSQHIDLDLDLDIGSAVDSAAASFACEDSILPTRSGAECDQLLSDQWHYIMTTYIEEHSESQINLSYDTFRGLVTCDASKAHPPSPCVLMAAKSEVMHLIHENTYHPFTQTMHNLCSEDRCAFAEHTMHATGVPLAPSGLRACVSADTHIDPLRNETHLAPLSKPTMRKVALVPQKRWSKFLLPFSGHSSTSGSESCCGSLGPSPVCVNTHAKQHTASTCLSRTYSSAPQSPAALLSPSRRLSPFSSVGPEDFIPRSKSATMSESTHQSPFLLGKLWRKRR